MSAAMAHTDGPSQAEILHLASLREVLSGFAHEIAQPLNAIMIATQVIQLKIDRSLLTDAEKTFLIQRLNIVASQVQRATGIVDGVRGFSRRDVSDTPLTDTAQIFGKIYNLMEQQFIVRGIQVTLERVEELPACSANVSLIEGAVVQGLAFSRDAIGAIGHWHDSRGVSYERILRIKLQAGNGMQAIRWVWNCGALPPGTCVSDPAGHTGLTVASSLLSEIGGSLNTKDGELTITFPSQII